MHQRTLKGMASIGLCAALTLAFYIAIAAPGQPASASALPPRYTPTPTSRPTTSELKRGYIELRLYSSTSTPLYSVVQWVDGMGNWHDVTGWQDTPQNVNEYRQSRWWVYPHDYGKGPFRWAIFQAEAAQSGAPLAVSQSFSLPLTDNDVVMQQVIIPAQ